jgi:hypothetical protein
MAPPPTLHELIATVRQDSPSDDVLDLVATASTTVTELSTLADSVLDHFVAGARREGRSWAEISSVLGVSKQAAHKRFAPAAPTDAGYERYTDRARRTVAAAIETAKGLGHPFVGTEHLLLAQFAEPQSIAARLLAAHGVTHEGTEAKVLAVIPRADPITDGTRPAFTPRAKVVFGAAVAEALNMGHNYIGTEHLLLAFFRDPESLAAQVLDQLGLDAERVRADVIEALSAIIRGRELDARGGAGGDAPTG